MQWVADYERGWRAGDVSAVERLFAPDAEYRASPYEPALVGHAGIREIWLADDGRLFTMHAEPVAVEGRVAVVRVEVHYEHPERQEYRDLWVIRFGADGRAEAFEEWAYWPGRPYSAAADRE